MKKAREGYKMTELGEIPKEWEVKKISDVSEVINGGTPNTKIKEYWENGNIFWATPTDITSNGKYICKTEKTINEKGLKNSAANILPVGSILMTSRATIGERCINKFPMATNQGFKSFICNDNYLNNEFMYYYIDKIKESFIKLAGGSTFLEVSKKAIDEFKILCPPIKEQKKIADILSTVDEHIEATESLIEKTKELKKGLMQRLLTKGIGHTRFKKTEVGVIPVEWEVNKLGDVFRVSSGNFLSQKNIITGQYPVYGGNGISGYHNEFLFKDSKIVIGRVGEKCGCICISKPKSWITDNALFIKEKLVQFSDIFMLYLLNYINLNKYANQSAQPVISGQKIYEIKVGIPKLDEQKQIATVLSSVDEQINQYEFQEENLKQLKNGLMQELLTGKLRVSIK